MPSTLQAQAAAERLHLSHFRYKGFLITIKYWVLAKVPEAKLPLLPAVDFHVAPTAPGDALSSMVVPAELPEEAPVLVALAAPTPQVESATAEEAEEEDTEAGSTRPDSASSRCSSEQMEEGHVAEELADEKSAQDEVQQAEGGSSSSSSGAATWFSGLWSWISPSLEEFQPWAARHGLQAALGSLFDAAEFAQWKQRPLVIYAGDGQDTSSADFLVEGRRLLSSRCVLWGTFDGRQDTMLLNLAPTLPAVVITVPLKLRIDDEGRTVCSLRHHRAFPVRSRDFWDTLQLFPVITEKKAPLGSQVEGFLRSLHQ